MEMEVEWLILADSAQVVGNKLYLLGGGWDRLTVNTKFPAQRQVGIAIAIKVPWNRTNEQHQFEIEIASEDAETVGKVEGNFEVGRAPGIPQGQDQRIQLAVGANLTFTKPGVFVIMAKIDGEERTHVPFYVTAGSGVAVAG